MPFGTLTVLGLGLTRQGSGGAAEPPELSPIETLAALFGPSDEGLLYAGQGEDSLYTDTGLTTLATTSDPIRGVRDYSGNGHTGTNVTSGAEPNVFVETGRRGLQYTAANADRLRFGAGGNPATAGVTIIIGMSTSATTGRILNYSTSNTDIIDIASSRHRCIFTTTTLDAAVYGWDRTAPHILTARLAGASGNELRYNGSTGPTNTSDIKSNTWSDMCLGARTDGVGSIEGKFDLLFIIFRVLSVSERNAAEAAAAELVGVTLAEPP